MSSPTVCFGLETALHLARFVDMRSLSPIDSRRIAACSANGVQVERSISRLEADHPGLSLPRPAHVLVPHACRRRLTDACRAHVLADEPEGRAFVSLGKTTFSSTVPFALMQMASQIKDPIELLELLYEACGTYQTKRTAIESAYQVENLATVDRIAKFCARNSSLRGARKVSRALAYVADASASARETKLALIVGLPKTNGGYGMGIPRMNYEVEASAAAKLLTGKSSFRCDLCWPEVKLDVEYQSRESHSGEESRIGDSRRTNALVAMGWSVICVTNNELDSVYATDAIASSIGHMLGKRCRIRVADYRRKQLDLRRRLGLPVW